MAVLCVLATLGLFVALVVAFQSRPQRSAASPSHPMAPTVASTRAVLLPRGGTVHVVGESHYQPALERIAGGRSDASAQVEVLATLTREPGNRYDSNAVAVSVDGRQVGYLSREDTVTFQPLLKGMEAHGEVATCAAVVVGGWNRGARGQGNFGVRLKLARPGQAPASAPPPASDAELVSWCPAPWSGCGWRRAPPGAELR